VIRPGTAADAEAVARVHVRTWQAAYAHVFPPERLAELSVERRADRWREWPPLVGVADGVIVGFVSVGASRDDEPAGELFAIYVDPEHWGTGVGRELIGAGEERLRELGHTNAMPASRLSTCPHARRRCSGPPSSPPPAAVHKSSASSGPTRPWATDRAHRPGRSVSVFRNVP
jgi:GNAT superfamily N-acetyltransferase